MTDDFPLAAEFPRTTQAEWRKLVDAALKGAAFDKRLVTHTYDGLRVEPLYGRAAGVKPLAGRAPGTAWALMQRLDHPDPAAANVQALQDLENGAAGLCLVFAGAPAARGYGVVANDTATLDRALSGVMLDLHHASHSKRARLPAGRREPVAWPCRCAQARSGKADGRFRRWTPSATWRGPERASAMARVIGTRRRDSEGCAREGLRQRASAARRWTRGA